MKTSFFVVRHLATKRLMPHTKGRGATSWEPSLGKDPYAAGHLTTPRLFARKIDAINSIRWWAEGEWVHDPEDGLPIRIAMWNPRHITTVLRKKYDLEIIEVELKEIGQLEMKV